jgi:hypothetical protein
METCMLKVVKGHDLKTHFYLVYDQLKEETLSSLFRNLGLPAASKREPALFVVLVLE